jgi:high-affinity iron transporter
MTFDFSAALPTFVITLREGVEAALVVGIVMACLQKAERRSLYPWVYGGIGSGLLASLGVGWVFLGLLQALDASSNAYAPVLKQVLETGFNLTAVVLLSWMLLWMTRQAKSLKSEVEGAVSQALDHPDRAWAAGLSILTLVAIAVLREGFETVVFIAAQFQNGLWSILGAIAGLMGAVGIGVLLFKMGVKINLRLFFQGMGILLLLIVAGLVITTLRHADQAIALWSQLHPQSPSFCFSTDSCVLGPLLWDTSAILPDRQFPGILLKAFFGYTQRLYWVQALAYLAFWVGIGGLYWRSIRTLQPVQSQGQSKTAPPSPETVAPSRSRK